MTSSSYAPQRVVHHDPACRVCRTAETGLVATGAPLPPPHPNPYHKQDIYGAPADAGREGGQHGHHWYHGTTFDPHEEDDEHAGDEHYGGELQTPEGYSGDYGERATQHWNTDLGVHFTALHHVASDEFASKGGKSPTSRVAHASLHMRNPIHFKDEDEFADHAATWAHGMGHRYLPKNIQAHKAFIHGNYEHVEEHDENEGSGRGYDYHEQSPLDTEDRERISDIDLHGPKHAGGQAQERWLGHHPDREQITTGYRRHLQMKGHDGVIYGNTYEGPHGHASAIAFPETPVHIHKWEWLHSDHPSNKSTPAKPQEHHDPNQLKLWGRLRVTAADLPDEYAIRHQWATNGRGKIVALHFSELPSADNPSGVSKQVGQLPYATRTKSKKVHRVTVKGQLEVHPDHQRKGLASAMMDRLQRDYPDAEVDHGERTDNGKSWWEGYTKGKDVTNGRTAANDWQFEHRQIERGPSWRTFGGPADNPRQHMVEYRVPQPGKVDFGANSMGGLDYLNRKHGPEVVDRMTSAVLDHHSAVPFVPKPKQERRVYYHGTTVPDVTHILPAAQHGGGAMFPMDTSPEHAYATPDKDVAWGYAEKASDRQRGMRPRVYQVRPIGGHQHVEDDPQHDAAGNHRGAGVGSVRSKRGFEVVREMKMPKNIGHPDDWDGEGNPTDEERWR